MLERGEPVSEEEVVIAPTRLEPLLHGGPEPTGEYEAPAFVREPLPQALPLAKQRLVCHFDRGGPGHGVTIEGEQS